MAIWELAHNMRPIVTIRCARGDVAKEECENEAIDRGLAVRLPAGLALVEGVEIYCLEDDDA